MHATHKWGSLVLALCLVSIVNVSAQADPLPGEVLKFKQAVQDGTTQVLNSQGIVVPWPYFGHDEESSAYLQQGGGNTSYITRPNGGQFMADDFEDTVNTPVVHVQWWGSYLGNAYRGVPPALLPNKFLIAWESDVPAGQDPNPNITWSHPGNVLQTEVVQLGALTPASGTYTEQLWQPAPVGSPLDDIFVYNAELALPFAQKANTVYWLKIVALFDQFNAAVPPIIWGWHNRDYTQPAQGFPTLTPAQEFDGVITDTTGTTVNIYHYLDDAVNGQMVLNLGLPPNPTTLVQTNYLPQFYTADDGPTGIQTHSKDLAFALYTIPEPSSLVLAACGIVGLMGYGLRRRRKN